MRFFRYSKTALMGSALLALAMLSSGCDYVRKVIAKDLLNQGAILYNQGRTKTAQGFFKDATETDPKNPVAWLYYGATLVREYKEKSGDEQKQVAGQALKAYETALSLSEGNCLNSDNAIGYIATIYNDINDEEKWREWMLKRADGSCATKEVKATSYYSIGVKYWNCSYDQTTRYQDKTAKDPFHYRNMDYPAALPDKAKAQACAVKGLEFVEKALQVDPEYVDAMFYKGLLYREQQKMTKEDGKRKELDATAKKIADEASALQKRKEEAAKAQQEAAAKG